MTNSFGSLGLNPLILSAIEELGFKNPTPIQEKAIPVLISEKKDVVGLAQTGTGKTAAFGLPIVNQTDFNAKHVQALIIAPTRELCLQICNDLKKYSSKFEEARVVAVYGGASIDNQIREIKKGAHIICATPGRMVDLLDRGSINISKVKVVVLDEADEMLNMGFKEDLDRILDDTPAEKNTWLFSATMPEEVARIAKNYMRDPFEISTGKANQSAENIEHIVYRIQPKDKYNVLRRIIDYYPDIFGIIFCRTKADTQEVADHLTADGYNADALHGDLSQYQRDMVMKRFRQKQLKVLCATDVAARGIDVNNITHVINYNLPEDTDNYTHRSGRTGRAGKSGISIVLAGGKDMDKIPYLERKLKKAFTRATVPTGIMICEKMIENYTEKIKNIDSSHHIPTELYQKAIDQLHELDKDELIKKLISTNFASLIDLYQKSNDVHTIDEKLKRSSENRNTPYRRFFMNVGKTDGITVPELINYICTELDCEKRNIGRIDLKNTFSFFELEKRYAEMAIDGLSRGSLRNRRVRVEEAEGIAGQGQSSHGSRSSKGGGGGFKSEEGGYARRKSEGKSYGSGKSEKGGYPKDKGRSEGRSGGRRGEGRSEGSGYRSKSRY